MSNTETELSIMNAAEPGISDEAARILILKYLHWKRAYHVADKNRPDENIFYCKAKASGDYDVLIWRGGESNGPLVAVARWRPGVTIHLGLGDPNDRRTQWTDMKRLHMLKLNFKVVFALSDGPTTFIWERTSRKDDGVKGTNKILPHFRVLNKDKGEVIAVFNTYWNGNGSLSFPHRLDRELEEWVTFGTVSIMRQMH